MEDGRSGGWGKEVGERGDAGVGLICEGLEGGRQGGEYF